LERHRVEVELLEIKLQGLKSVLQRNLSMIRQFESNPTGIPGLGAGLGGIPADQRAKMLDQLKVRSEDMSEEYKENRLQLARLKRQIARDSKALDQPPTETDPTSLNRRIESLESKVDQILQILSKEPR